MGSSLLGSTGSTGQSTVPGINPGNNTVGLPPLLQYLFGGTGLGGNSGGNSGGVSALPGMTSSPILGAPAQGLNSGGMQPMNPLLTSLRGMSGNSPMTSPGTAAQAGMSPFTFFNSNPLLSTSGSDAQCSIT